MASMGILAPIIMIAAAVLLIVTIAAIFKIFTIANLLQEIRNEIVKPKPQEVEEAELVS